MTASVATWRLRLAAIAASLVALHLGWEWSQGGIQSHHFLADASMPAFSNAWGLLWLPLLAVLYAPSIRRRALGPGLRARWRPGIVAGMVGVGAILPSIFAFAFAALSFAVHRGLVPALGYAGRRLRGQR